MPTQQEVTQTLRDGAHINAHALDLIADEAEENFDALRLWPDSPSKRALLAALADVRSAYRNAEQMSLKLKAAADEALTVYGGTPVPPPDYSDVPTAGGVAQWSRRDW